MTFTFTPCECKAANIFTHLGSGGDAILGGVPLLELSLLLFVCWFMDGLDEATDARVERAGN
jgi:hypothetical protein